MSCDSFCSGFRIWWSASLSWLSEGSPRAHWRASCAGRRVELGWVSPDLLATIARVAVWAFAIVVAVNQIGVAATLVNTLLTATVGALALALGLAFGLGGRETAGEILRNWIKKARTPHPVSKRQLETYATRHSTLAEARASPH